MSRRIDFTPEDLSGLTPQQLADRYGCSLSTAYRAKSTPTPRTPVKDWRTIVKDALWESLHEEHNRSTQHPYQINWAHHQGHLIKTFGTRVGKRSTHLPKCLLGVELFEGKGLKVTNPHGKSALFLEPSVATKDVGWGWVRFFLRKGESLPQKPSKRKTALWLYDRIPAPPRTPTAEEIRSVQSGELWQTEGSSPLLKVLRGVLGGSLWKGGSCSPWACSKDRLNTFDRRIKILGLPATTTVERGAKGTWGVRVQVNDTGLTVLYLKGPHRDSLTTEPTKEALQWVRLQHDTALLDGDEVVLVTLHPMTGLPKDLTVWVGDPSVDPQHPLFPLPTHLLKLHQPPSDGTTPGDFPEIDLS